MEPHQSRWHCSQPASPQIEGEAGHKRTKQGIIYCFRLTSRRCHSLREREFGYSYIPHSRFQFYLSKIRFLLFFLRCFWFIHGNPSTGKEGFHVDQLSHSSYGMFSCWLHLFSRFRRIPVKARQQNERKQGECNKIE